MLYESNEIIQSEGQTIRIGQIPVGGQTWMTWDNDNGMKNLHERESMIETYNRIVMIPNKEGMMWDAKINDD